MERAEKRRRRERDREQKDKTERQPPPLSLFRTTRSSITPQKRTTQSKRERYPIDSVSISISYKSERKEDSNGLFSLSLFLSLSVSLLRVHVSAATQRTSEVSESRRSGGAPKDSPLWLMAISGPRTTATVCFPFSGTFCDLSDRKTSHV
jgi:hypothetical protein